MSGWHHCRQQRLSGNFLALNKAEKEFLHRSPVRQCHLVVAAPQAMSAATSTHSVLTMFAHASAVTCRRQTGDAVSRRPLVPEHRATRVQLSGRVFQAPTVTAAFVAVVLATSKSLDSVSLGRRQDAVARCNEKTTKYPTFFS